MHTVLESGRMQHASREFPHDGVSGRAFRRLLPLAASLSTANTQTPPRHELCTANNNAQFRCKCRLQ
jgi:hypothetical protein